MDLNSLKITEFTENTELTLTAPLFDIETNNTLEATVLGIPAESANTFQFQKTSAGAVLNTLIPGDSTLELAIIAQTEEKQSVRQIQFRIALKA